MVQAECAVSLDEAAVLMSAGRVLSSHLGEPIAESCHGCGISLFCGDLRGATEEALFSRSLTCCLVILVVTYSRMDEFVLEEVIMLVGPLRGLGC